MSRIIILAVIAILGVVGMILMFADAAKADEVIDVQAGVEDEIPEISDAEADKIADEALLNPPVTFSHTETFYNRTISVELFSENPDAVIYYTLDGSPPVESLRNCAPDGFPAGTNIMCYCRRREDRCSFHEGFTVEALADGSDPYCYITGLSFNTRRLPPAPPPPAIYTGAIEIKAGGSVTATTIKAVAVVNGTYSEVVTKSYVTGEDVWERFTPETYIFVLSSDPYDISCHYHGIAVEGFLRQQYFQHEARNNNPDPPEHANYNMRGRESERPMYVEVFDYSGNTLISQAAGVRVAGGWSRAREQKSLRLIARTEYSRGKFNFPLFDDIFNSDGQLITRFDRLALRNGGNDREEAAIRDELISELARQAGFRDTYTSAPAAVFLNGEYYGFAWLKEVLNEGFLEQIYGGNKSNYQIIENNERGSGWNNTDFALEDWRYVYGLAEEGFNSGDGFKDDALFEEFCSLVDMDSFMLYYAIQIYVSNTGDWPHNNLKVWRYYPDEDEVITNPFLDGKWRFIMFDTEFSLGLYGRSHFATNTLRDALNINSLPAGNGRSLLLWAVLQRDDMKEKFANTICDLIDGAFAHENVIATLNRLADSMQHEFYYAIENSSLAGWLIWTYEEKRDQIRNFSRGRAEYIQSQMTRIFELGDETVLYSVTLTGAESAHARLNTRFASENETITANYLSGFEVPLSAVLYPGYEVASWEINGVHHYTDEIKLNAGMADSGGHINIQLHTNKMIEGVPLYINELSTSSGADWITLYNPNQVAISTRVYYLSDDINNLTRWKVPTINIQPEESLMIVMSNNRTPEALMKPQASFNLSAGETLYLSDTDGNIIASVQIPETQKGEIMRRERDGSYIVVME